MNTEGPDKQTITHYSDTIRAELTAQQRAQNPTPARWCARPAHWCLTPRYPGPVCATNSPKRGKCSSSKGQTLNEAQHSQNETRCTSALNAQHVQHQQPTGTGMSPPINWEGAHRLPISVPQQSGLCGSGPPICKAPMNTFVCIIKIFSLAYGLPSTPSFPAVEEGVLEDTAENTALANGNGY